MSKSEYGRYVSHVKQWVMAGTRVKKDTGVMPNCEPSVWPQNSQGSSDSAEVCTHASGAKCLLVLPGTKPGIPALLATVNKKIRRMLIEHPPKAH
eukprot:1144925-Pelagomonas_calceolata.AAC.2